MLFSNQVLEVVKNADNDIFSSVSLSSMSIFSPNVDHQNSIQIITYNYTGSLLGPGTLVFFSITDKVFFDHSIFRNQTETEATEICKHVSFGILHISERLIQLENVLKNKRRHLILFYFYYFTVIDCRSEKIFSSPKIYNVKGFFRQWIFYINGFYLRCSGFFSTISITICELWIID